MTVPPSVPSIPLQVRSLLPDAIYYSLARVLTLPAPNITLPSLNLAPPQPPSSHWSSQPSSETSSARVGVSGSSVSLSSDAVKEGASSSEEDVVVARLPRQPLLAIVTAGTSDLAVAEVSWQQKQVNAMSRTGSLSLDCESACPNTLCLLMKLVRSLLGRCAITANRPADSTCIAAPVSQTPVSDSCPFQVSKRVALPHALPSSRLSSREGFLQWILLLMSLPPSLLLSACWLAGSTHHSSPHGLPSPARL